MLHRTIFLSFAVVLTSACGGNTETPDGGKPIVTEGGTDTPVVAEGGADTNQEPIGCAPVTSSTLPHVHIVVDATKCTFTLAEAAAKISIPYDLVVDEDVPGFVPTQPYWYGSTAANLALQESLGGGGQGYCLCDQGLPYPQCPLDDGGLGSPDGGATGACGEVTIPAGTYHRVFTWDGRNWTGPSDTDNPEGPPFPAGDYAFDVSTQVGSIGDAGALGAEARLPIRLVP